MTASENGTDLAVLDQLDPTFTPTGPAVRAARAAGSCARTRDGYAVLRHDALVALLADRRLVKAATGCSRCRASPRARSSSG